MPTSAMERTSTRPRNRPGDSPVHRAACTAGRGAPILRIPDKTSMTANTNKNARQHEAGPESVVDRRRAALRERLIRPSQRASGSVQRRRSPAPSSTLHR